jgi:hypothetical protein
VHRDVQKAPKELADACRRVRETRHFRHAVHGHVERGLADIDTYCRHEDSPIKWTVESIAPKAHAYRYEVVLVQLFGRRARDPACGPC